MPSLSAAETGRTLFTLRRSSSARLLDGAHPVQQTMRTPGSCGRVSFLLFGSFAAVAADAWKACEPSSCDAGVAEGCAFQVELPEPLDMSGLSMEAPTEPAEFHAETDTKTEKDKAKLKIIEDAMAAGRLTSDQAALLQYLMESLYDFDALDDFIDAHARQAAEPQW